MSCECECEEERVIDEGGVMIVKGGGVREVS